MLNILRVVKEQKEKEIKAPKTPYWVYIHS